jgi:hypothetical protein
MADEYGARSAGGGGIVSQSPHKRDPFSLVATAAAYVPRPVT